MSETDNQGHHHETAEEFVDEVEVAALETVEEIKDLPHFVAEKVREATHHEHGNEHGHHDQRN